MFLSQLKTYLAQWKNWRGRWKWGPCYSTMSRGCDARWETKTQVSLLSLGGERFKMPESGWRCGSPADREWRWGGWAQESWPYILWRGALSFPFSQWSRTGASTVEQQTQSKVDAYRVEVERWWHEEKLPQGGAITTLLPCSSNLLLWVLKFFFKGVLICWFVIFWLYLFFLKKHSIQDIFIDTARSQQPQLEERKIILTFNPTLWFVPPARFHPKMSFNGHDDTRKMSDQVALTHTSEDTISHIPVPKVAYRSWSSWMPAARNTSWE